MLSDQGFDRYGQMNTPPLDAATRRAQRRLRRALRHRNASPYVRQIKEQRDADAQRRREVFASGAPEYWTEIIRRAQDYIVSKGLRDPLARPCDYAPWKTALAALGAKDFGLGAFAHDLCRPPWPDDRQHLIAFALAFLEADPMFHRSGYIKRHLLDRLRQSTLNSAQADRLGAILQRAVQEGTGLEEFRACCRIAAALNPSGLVEWLRPIAATAKLNRGRHLPAEDLRQLPPDYGEKGFAGWSDPLSFRPPGLAIPADLCSAPIPMKPDDWAAPQNRCAVNAWRMLRAIERRSQAGDVSS
jgi:hypothetical protein